MQLIDIAMIDAEADVNDALPAVRERSGWICRHMPRQMLRYGAYPWRKSMCGEAALTCDSEGGAGCCCSST